MTAGRPIVIRRAEPADAQAIHETFLGPRAIAGTLQLPYPSVEMWRKRLAEVSPDDRTYAFRDGRYVDAYQMARLNPALKMNEAIVDE